MTHPQIWVHCFAGEYPQFRRLRVNIHVFGKAFVNRYFCFVGRCYVNIPTIVDYTNTHTRTYIYLYIYIYMYTYAQHVCIYTSSTTQGGGGSFRNRKPIGEVGCCDSQMGVRIPTTTTAATTTTTPTTTTTSSTSTSTPTPTSTSTSTTTTTTTTATTTITATLHYTTIR